jgi:tetratricopeptide (TPR) repeat protein
MSINPSVADGWSSRGTAFNDLRRYGEALADFDRALALNPRLAEAHANKGNSLTSLRRFGEAHACFEAALALNANLAESWAGLGRLLFETNRYDAADEALKRALAIRSDLVVAWLDRGNLFMARNRPEEAIECFRRAQAIRPDDAEAHFAEACCRLKFGDAAKGWRKYEWRLKVGSLRAAASFDKPLWLGDRPIAGKTILLYPLQGFGDTIQFCRFATAVADLGARVILEVQPELKSLLARLAGPETIIASGEARPNHDLHCPIASLPLALRITPGDLGREAYVSAPPAGVASWQNRLAGARRPRIGIAWAGNPAFRGDHNRSIGLPQLLPALSAIDAQFVSLQMGASDEDKRLLKANGILHCESCIGDFGDTAALMQCLDLVVSSDTSIVHLAGALGRNLWILLCYDADWRWLADRADSPWYPTARLFRQRAPGDWQSVVEQIVERWRSLPIA